MDFLDKNYGFDWNTEHFNDKHKAWVYIYGRKREDFIKGIKNAHNDGFIKNDELERCYEAIDKFQVCNSSCVGATYRISLSWK